MYGFDPQRVIDEVNENKKTDERAIELEKFTKVPIVRMWRHGVLFIVGEYENGGGI